MAQRTNPAAVTFKADGKTYTLLCDMNALVDFEIASGAKAFAVLNGNIDDLSLEHVRILFWAMLQEHHPDLDQRSAGRLMVAAKDKMADAVKAAFPAPEETVPVGKPKASPRRR